MAIRLEGVLLSSLSDRGAVYKLQVNSTTIIPIRVNAAVLRENLRAVGLSTGARVRLQCEFDAVAGECLTLYGIEPARAGGLGSGAASPPPPPPPPPLPPGSLPGLSGRMRVLAAIVSLTCANGTNMLPGGTVEEVRAQLQLAAGMLSTCSRNTFGVEFSVITLPLSCSIDVDRSLFVGTCDEMRISQRLLEALQQQQQQTPANGTSSSNSTTTAGSGLGSGAHKFADGAADIAARLFVLPKGAGTACTWRGMAIPDKQAVLLPSEVGRGLRMPWVVVHDREDDPTSAMGCGAPDRTALCPAEGNVCLNAPQVLIHQIAKPYDMVYGTSAISGYWFTGLLRAQPADSTWIPSTLKIVIRTFSADGGVSSTASTVGPGGTGSGATASTGYSGACMCNSPYTVLPEDTLRKISLKCGGGLTINSLVAANNILDPDMIYDEQRLQLPGCPGFSTGNICLCTSPYTVKDDDDLWKISMYCSGGLTEQSIATANKLPDVEYIEGGQILILPGCAVDPAATANGGEAGSGGLASGGGSGGKKGHRRLLAAAAAAAPSPTPTDSETAAAPPPIEYNDDVDTSPRNITVQVCRYLSDANKECPPPKSPPPPPQLPSPPRPPSPRPPQGSRKRR
ncbi:hypothetical protein HXX76_002573 [Chlamydomonas incerta]|uniref:LysM domain-containing protein n=1 Tax=Chlamydomonas incerta TaxID=51695 RepID=A0A835TEY9_CHLIN|nr:hypothetical protein HXX76_002573 [Chlamydomonas incerta]|eukprot:KAG2442487.1 hypothetical protein HXX76_002573 [Chlamydomonas incerta]